MKGFGTNIYRSKSVDSGNRSIICIIKCRPQPLAMVSYYHLGAVHILCRAGLLATEVVDQIIIKTMISNLLLHLFELAFLVYNTDSFEDFH